MNSTRPEVGDLVAEVGTNEKWVCTDIVGASSKRPVWVLRPVHASFGYGTVKVDHHDIVGYSVTARRGSWRFP
ncbi:hypothetical protein AB0D04_16115 [Streptomyces sp. NPDC048483]|uniref:hypothetical protein n=1 Tax=Streptomyces sp. NPDC048483 TaxID=3154927 RepID=UPI003414E980